VECRFSEKADIMSGGTPKTDEASYYGGSIPFYTPKDSVDNFFSFETLTNITEEGLAHCNSQFYPAKTVMITARGTVGNINLLAVPMAMNQSCYALKMKAVDCPYFLFFSLMQEIKKIKCIATGGVFDTIIVKTFDTIRIVMPKTNMLMQFEKAVSPMMEQILCIEKKNKNLICQRDLLLPRLMSGKLEVK
jgi:type I restriction enzyme S subunit